MKTLKIIGIAMFINIALALALIVADPDTNESAITEINRIVGITEDTANDFNALQEGEGTTYITQGDTYSADQIWNWIWFIPNMIGIIAAGLVSNSLPNESGNVIIQLLSIGLGIIILFNNIAIFLAIYDKLIARKAE